MKNRTKSSKVPIEPLVATLCVINDSGEMNRFLDEILTPSERSDLDLRWQLMDMLLQGVPQRTIAETLGISLCKITRGAKVLKADGSVCKKHLSLKKQ